MKRLDAGTDLATVEGLRDSPIFRRAMMVMTLAWGVGLVAESALSCVLLFVTTIQQFMLASWVIGVSIVGAYGLDLLVRPPPCRGGESGRGEPSRLTPRRALRQVTGCALALWPV